MKNLSQTHCTTYQLKLPVDIERIIEINDPVYTFCEVVDHIDLYKYLAVEEHEAGRPRYDQTCLTENCTVRIHGTWLCIFKRDRKAVQNRHSVHVVVAGYAGTEFHDYRQFHKQQSR